MKKKILYILTLCFILFSAINLEAQEEVYVGGYDIIKIFKSTFFVLKEKKHISEADYYLMSEKINKEQQDPLNLSPALLKVYEQVGEMLIKKDIATKDEIKDINNLAQKSGGIKIAGVNPLILEAAYLDLLVRKNILKLEQAQLILDNGVKNE